MSKGHRGCQLQAALLGEKLGICLDCQSHNCRSALGVWENLQIGEEKVKKWEGGAGRSRGKAGGYKTTKQRVSREGIKISNNLDHGRWRTTRQRATMWLTLVERV